MRKFALTAATAALTLGLAAPAFAQDGPPPPRDDATFTGARAGVILGYDKLQPGRGPNSDIGSNRKADGLTYGGDIGYDAAFHGVVLGVEGEVTGSTADVSNAPISAGALGYGRVKTGRDLYVGGRLGYVVAPKTMIYAKGGYTNARLDLTANNGTVTTGNHYNLDGYRVGAGVEQKIGRTTYAKVEYRYSNYGDARLEYANGGNTNNFSVNTDRHQVVAGVGVRF
ncbi:outer membrane protein [Sphingomonas sp. 10B4]|uniref:outer membrane protein n=1 Tax=Sphingomonas sp. 10B4 TaxID=3048575 RepID=UPI002AB42F7E|nr:outer membrane beta-barrel protein [Sphingomonas sp. 10B4]MDY7524163.1 outer membrane beta-barrel protein [Sphingomonas sp. 10B4]MEB0284047.1 outer membrane beta-barrel protein [Sphingomonas sp. 10B4]